MKTHIVNLIKTDIHLCRLTHQLKQLGFETSVLKTENLSFILYFLKMDECEEMADFYYRWIENAIQEIPEQDDQSALELFRKIIERPQTVIA